MSLFNCRKSKTYLYSFLLIILCFISFIPPKTVSAGAVVWDPGNFVPNWTTGVASGFLVTKEFGLDAVAWFAANLIIKKMVASTVNWINNGFKGNPAYVTDPSQFFLDVGDETASYILSNTNLNQLCTPFRAQVRLALVKNYLSETSNQSYSCSLDLLKNNYDAFINDFDQGGWDGWFELTQNSQNNPYGAYMNAQNQLSIEIGNTQNKYQQQLAQGRGFLSLERCKPGTENPAVKGDCAPVNRETVTPGTVIEQQLEGVLSIGNNRLIQADEIDEIISALLNQLISKVLGGGNDGLRGTSENTNGPSYTSNLSDEPEEGSSRDEVTCTTDANGVADCTMNEPPPPPPPDVPGGTVVCKPDGDGGYVCTSGDGGNSSGGTVIPGPQCAETGNSYQEIVETAIDQVLIENPSVASSMNTAENSRNFLNLVAEKIESTTSYNATADVLNGNNNPSRGDLVAVWANGDIVMERYDAITSVGSGTIPLSQAARAGFVGFIPLTCTSTGGSTDCGCKTSGGGTDPGGGTGGGTTGIPAITSVNPTTVTPGLTTVTISGTNLTSTVRFFDPIGGRWSVVGTVNTAKTQTSVVVPAGIQAGNGSVRIYSVNGDSNALSITYNNSVVETSPSVNTVSGKWGALSYNPTLNNWLVVGGTDPDIFSMIVANDGTPIGGQTRINSNTAAPTQVSNPKVVFAPNLNKYLVTWIAFDPSSIYGRFVNPDGTYAGDPFLIWRDAGGASFIYTNSLLQYDSLNKKFVLVWEYRTPRLNSNMITINESGTPGPMIPITTDATSSTGADGSPAVAVNTTNGEYCIVYSSFTGVGATGWSRTINMKRYNPTTGVLGARTIVDTKNSPSTNGWPTIVYNSVNNKYMVGWESGSLSQARILNSCTGTDGAAAFTSNSSGGGQSISYNPTSNTYASIVQDQNDSANTFKVMNSSGTLLRSGIVFVGGFGNFNPVIIGNTTDGTYSAVSSYEYGTMRFATGL